MPERQLYRDIVDVLLAEHEKTAPPAGAADEDSAKLLGCVWGLYCQIHRHARAAVLLHDNAMEHEAGIMARVMMEHTVVMHWIVERGDKGVDALLANQAKRMETWLHRTTTESSLSIPEEIASRLRDSFKDFEEAQALKQFDKICNEVRTEDLYAAYGYLSSFVHPTTTTSNMYCDSSGNLTLSPLQKDEDYISLVASCLIWTERDFDRLTPDHPKADGLERLASSIQAVPVLPKYRAIPPAPKKKRGRANRGRKK